MIYLQQKVHLAPTPLALMKCIKTEAEMKGMEHSQVYFFLAPVSIYFTQ